MTHVTAVLFDVGGVFTFPDAALLQRALEVLGPLSLEAETCRRAHYHGVAALSRSQQSGLPQPWGAYYEAFLATLGLLTADHLNVLQTTFEEMEGRLWVDIAVEHIEVTDKLATDGFRIAMLSNSDGTVERILRERGVCQVGKGPLLNVEFVLDSEVVGFAKPDPRIFELAIAQLGIDAQAILYVGDNVWSDVLGALKVGMNAVLLDPFDLHLDLQWRIRNLRDLESTLALPTQPTSP